MGVIFFVVFMIALFVIGAVGIIAGITGIFVFRKKRKNGDTVGIAFTAVSAIVLIVGCLVMFIPVAFFSFILLLNTLP